MDLSSLSSVGDLLGGMGQLMAGSGLFGGQEVDVHSIDNSYRAMATGMNQAAEILGVNPMAMLGVTPYNANVTYSGVDPAQMGQGLNKMLSAGQSNLQKAQIGEIEAKTNLLNAQARKLIDDMPTGQGIIEKDLPVPQNRALAPGITPSEIVVQNQRNILDFYPSQDVQDYMTESMWDNWKYRLQKFWDGWSKTLKEGKTSEIRDFLDDLESTHPPQAGWYYQWNTYEGRPEAVRYKGGTKKLVKPYSGMPDRLKEDRYSGFGEWRNTK